ncbi:hypothetical protein [Streptomyces sp. NPDC058280]|uniref:hypothetical protein n=1 Tax=Streptomyces sp. NPDC058280 TaxID=3346419 RepID=UPI0036E8B266
MTATQEARASTETVGRDICHLYCCDPNTAICGTDISQHAEVSTDIPVDCVVCVDDTIVACPICGAVL